MPSSFSKKSAMLRLLLENSTTLMYLVQDHLRLNYGYQRKRSNNKRKPRKTEKFIKFLTKSLKVLEIWEYNNNQDRPFKEDNHSHKGVMFHKAMDSNTNNNNSKDKEAVDT